MLFINIIGAYHSGLRNSCSIFHACFPNVQQIKRLPIHMNSKLNVWFFKSQPLLFKISGHSLSYKASWQQMNTDY